jgi:hypothetical protein
MNNEWGEHGKHTTAKQTTSSTHKAEIKIEGVCAGAQRVSCISAWLRLLYFGNFRTSDEWNLIEQTSHS